MRLAFSRKTLMVMRSASGNVVAPADPSFLSAWISIVAAAQMINLPAREKKRYQYAVMAVLYLFCRGRVQQLDVLFSTDYRTEGFDWYVPHKSKTRTWCSRSTMQAEQQESRDRRIHTHKHTPPLESSL